MAISNWIKLNWIDNLTSKSKLTLLSHTSSKVILFFYENPLAHQTIFNFLFISSELCVDPWHGLEIFMNKCVLKQHVIKKMKSSATTLIRKQPANRLTGHVWIKDFNEWIRFTLFSPEPIRVQVTITSMLNVPKMFHIFDLFMEFDIYNGLYWR